MAAGAGALTGGATGTDGGVSGAGRLLAMTGGAGGVRVTALGNGTGGVDGVGCAGDGGGTGAGGGACGGARRTASAPLLAARSGSVSDGKRIFGSHCHSTNAWISSDSTSVTQNVGIVTPSRLARNSSGQLIACSMGIVICGTGWTPRRWQKFQDATPESAKFIV